MICFLKSLPTYILESLVYIWTKIYIKLTIKNVVVVVTSHFETCQGNGDWADGPRVGCEVEYGEGPGCFALLAQALVPRGCWSEKSILEFSNRDYKVQLCYYIIAYILVLFYLRKKLTF